MTFLSIFYYRMHGSLFFLDSNSSFLAHFLVSTNSCFYFNLDFDNHFLSSFIPFSCHPVPKAMPHLRFLQVYVTPMKIVSWQEALWELQSGKRTSQVTGSLAGQKGSHWQRNQSHIWEHEDLCSLRSVRRKWLGKR